MGMYPGAHCQTAAESRSRGWFCRKDEAKLGAWDRKKGKQIWSRASHTAVEGDAISKYQTLVF